MLTATAIILALATWAPTAADLSTQDRDKLVKYLTTTRDQVLAESAKLSDAQWNFKPGPDRNTTHHDPRGGEHASVLAAARELDFVTLTGLALATLEVPRGFPQHHHQAVDWAPDRHCRCMRNDTAGRLGAGAVRQHYR